MRNWFSRDWRNGFFIRYLGVKETLDEAVSAIGLNHIQVKHTESGYLAVLALFIFQRS